MVRWMDLTLWLTLQISTRKSDKALNDSDIFSIWVEKKAKPVPFFSFSTRTKPWLAAERSPASLCLVSTQSCFKGSKCGEDHHVSIQRTCSGRMFSSPPRHTPLFRLCHTDGTLQSFCTHQLRDNTRPSLTPSGPGRLLRSITVQSRVPHFLSLITAFRAIHNLDPSVMEK